jgi:hypothetical protein
MSKYDYEDFSRDARQAMKYLVSSRNDGVDEYCMERIIEFVEARYLVDIATSSNKDLTNERKCGIVE